MTTLTIAEVLAGETLVSPGGLVERATAMATEAVIWGWPHRVEAAPTAEKVAVVLVT